MDDEIYEMWSESELHYSYMCQKKTIHFRWKNYRVANKRICYSRSGKGMMQRGDGTFQG